MQRTGRNHIAMFLSSLQGGGAERVFLDLAEAFRRLGHRVDLVVSQLRGELASQIPDSVRVLELGVSSPFRVIQSFLRLPAETWRLLLPKMVRRRRKKMRSLPRLERYLTEERPEVLLASTNVPNLLGIWAASLAGGKTRVFIKQDNLLSPTVRETTDPLERELPLLIRRWYPKADGIIAVSASIADELIQEVNVPQEKVRVIYNPVNLRRIAALADAAIDDPWFRPGQPPVLVAAGRLHRQKDYPTLLRAFHLLRGDRKIRLLILGEGKERPRLEALIDELGITEDVRLPGFHANPYAYMARAAVFVLASRWEGLPTVLIEALACGCRVVSTDCRHGPAEILERGKYGVLVPVQDPDALARAIGQRLGAGTDLDGERRRAADFAVDAVARQYLRLCFDRDAPSGSAGR